MIWHTTLPITITVEPQFIVLEGGVEQFFFFFFFFLGGGGGGGKSGLFEGSFPCTSILPCLISGVKIIDSIWVLLLPCTIIMRSEWDNYFRACMYTGQSLWSIHVSHKSGNYSVIQQS